MSEVKFIWEENEGYCLEWGKKPSGEPGNVGVIILKWYLRGVLVHFEAIELPLQDDGRPPYRRLYPGERVKIAGVKVITDEAGEVTVWAQEVRVLGLDLYLDVRRRLKETLENFEQTGDRELVPAIRGLARRCFDLWPRLHGSRRGERWLHEPWKPIQEQMDRLLAPVEEEERAERAAARVRRYLERTQQLQGLLDQFEESEDPGLVDQIRVLRVRCKNLYGKLDKDQRAECPAWERIKQRVSEILKPVRDREKAQKLAEQAIDLAEGQQATANDLKVKLDQLKPYDHLELACVREAITAMLKEVRRQIVVREAQWNPETSKKKKPRYLQALEDLESELSVWFETHPESSES